MKERELIPNTPRTSEFPKVITSIYGFNLTDTPQPTDVVNTGKDIIFVPKRVTLPAGMTIDDIQDACNAAKAYQKQAVDLFVAVSDRVVVKDKNGTDYEVAGVHRSYKGLNGIHRIELSVGAANETAAHPSPDPLYDIARAHQQLWAVAFEETLHAARREANVGDPSTYFSLPANPTRQDLIRYMTQDEEIAIERALNSGILQAKFGPTARYRLKTVMHQRPEALQITPSYTKLNTDVKRPLRKKTIIYINSKDRQLLENFEKKDDRKILPFTPHIIE